MPGICERFLINFIILLLEKIVKVNSNLYLQMRDCQKIILQTKSPAELSQIHGFNDFPLPQRIETLVRPKRNLKSTKDKEEMTKDAKR
jgi:hypothetical protein